MYTPEQIEQFKAVVIQKLGEGVSLVKICQAEGMPSRESIRQWQEADEQFLARCVRAREDAVEAEAQRLIEIADDLEIPPEHKKHMISARQWNASKLLPKKYGDKLDVTSGGDKIQPAVIILPPEVEKTL